MSTSKRWVTRRTPQSIKDQARKYRELVPVLEKIPTSFFCPTLPARNQGQYPDCPGFGTADQQDRRVALDFPSCPFLTSPLYSFLKGGGGPNGGIIYNTLEALATDGICKESTFPITLLTDINNLPAIPAAADAEAAKYKAGPPALIQSLAELKDAISKTGPEGTGPAVTLGVAVYSESFENAPGGIILPPTTVANDAYLGDHDICADGYDDKMVTPAYPTPGYVRFVNSWGPAWGDPNNRGYGWIHYSQIINPDLVLEMWGSVDEIGQPQPAPAAGDTANATLSLVVNPAALVITTTNLPDNKQGLEYEYALLATGGTAPYTWSATGLPAGLTAGAGGIIQGAPAESGNFSVAISVTDNGNPEQTASISLNLIIAPGVPALEITTETLPAGQVGVAYIEQVEAAGGVAPYTWSAAGLPPGLTIDPEAGVISGTPTAAVTNQVVITVTDSSGAGAKKVA